VPRQEDAVEVDPRANEADVLIQSKQNNAEGTRYGEHTRRIVCWTSGLVDVRRRKIIMPAPNGAEIAGTFCWAIVKAFHSSDVLESVCHWHIMPVGRFRLDRLSSYAEEHTMIFEP
jgi:hypothetical protein